MKRMLHLPDVNIWVALTFDSHPNHPAAHKTVKPAANLEEAKLKARSLRNRREWEK